MWIRLKLIAPFHRPREPRPPFLDDGWEVSPSPSLSFFLAMTALRLHQVGFARHGRPADLLAHVGTMDLARRRAERHPVAAVERRVDGFDDGHVDEAFLAGR